MAPLEYQDFDLKIERIPGKDNRYRVDVINSPSGQAKGEFDLPFSDQELDRLRHTSLPTLEDAKDFGRTLFTSVFAEQIYTCLQRSFDAAHGKGQGVRLCLRLTDVPVLADLPWEFLFDTRSNRFLATSTITSLVRYLDLPKREEPLSVSLPLRILVMIANPYGNHSAALDVEAEWQKIRNSLDNLEKRGQVELTRLEAANLNVLKHQLRQAQYHIFHYVGHGRFDQKIQKGVLLLEDSEGRTFIEDGQHLGVLLHDHPSLRLALLNTCDAGRSGHVNPFGGVAQHLVQQGIPAVIAMQSEITDTSAITIAHEFYTALARSCSVDEALAEARQTIYIGGNDIEWATSVLYMRTRDSQLFSLLTEQSDDNSGLTKSAVEVEVGVPVREAIFRAAEDDIAEPFLHLWELQNVLAYLYDEEVSIRRVVANAGLNAQFILFSGRSIDTWHSIIKEAAKLYKIDNLFQVACTEYDTNPRLQELYHAYLEAVDQGKNPEVSIELQSEHAEYKEWHVIQNLKFEQSLRSEISSKSAFRQALNVADEKMRLIERQKLWTSLDIWFSNWRKRKTFVLLGEEGDGKTWGVASWLHKKIAEDTAFPPVVFLPASQVSSNNPWGLISNAVRPHSGYVSGDKWNDLVKQWLDYPSQTKPTLLIVLDGINQWHDPSWWRLLLEKMMVDEEFKDEYSEGKYFANVAFIVTCRAEYWERNYRILTNLPFTPFFLQPYNDNELEQALNLNHLKRSEFSGKLLELVRKPRWFNSAVMHRNEIGSMEDVTVIRLVYEDWRYIYNQKSDIPISDIEFRDLLRQLAEKQMKRTSFLKRQDLNQIINLYPNHRTLLEELRTGRKLHVREGNVRLSEPLMGLGLGLLLVDQLLVAYTESKRDLSEIAASWLEDNSGKDFNAYICEMAVLHALPDPDIAQEIKVTLLLVWLNNQNLTEDVETKFTAYLLDNTDSYLKLCESIWTNDTDNRKAQDLLMSAFLYWYPKSSQVRKALEIAIERWLGMVHVAGFPKYIGNKSGRTEDAKERIVQRIGFSLPLGNFTFAGRTVTAIDNDGLLRLGRAALAIISHFPRGPFVHSIATGCVAEAIMGWSDKYELFKWVLSTSSDSVWLEVCDEVNRLLSFDSLIAQHAAYHLLSFEGSRHAYGLRKSLPSDLFPVHSFHLEYEKEPWRFHFPWNRQTCEICIHRTDFEAQYIVRGIQLYAPDPTLTIPPDAYQRFKLLAETIAIEQVWSTMTQSTQDFAFEQYEPGLCAFTPYAIGNVVRKIVQDIPTRTGLALQQISFRLREHALLFEQEEMNNIYQAWKQISRLVTPWKEEYQTAETRLFALVLLNLSAQEQLEHLLQRPNNVEIDLLQYERYFLPIRDWDFVEDLLARKQTERSLIRLLWFISVNAEQIPASFLFVHIMPFLESSSAQIRCLALKIIRNSHNRYLSFAVVGCWKPDSNNIEEENFLGSSILCEYGGLLTLEEICRRTDPLYWGYAVKCRGNSSSEVDFLAQKIHTIWKRISNLAVDMPQNLPEATLEITLPANQIKDNRRSLYLLNRSKKSMQWRSPDQTWGGVSISRNLASLFPPENEINEQQARNVTTIQTTLQEEITAGNPWFARYFDNDGLEEVVVKRPDLVEQWLHAVSEQKSYRLRLLQKCHSFYEALCIVLLKCNPEKGVNLYLQMDRVNILSRDAQTKWRIVERELFQTSPVGVIDGLWRKQLEDCTTDAQLLTLATMLQWGTGKEWLWAYIDQQLGSNTPLGLSRGITLLGYYDSDLAQEQLNKLLDEAAPKTWSKELLEKSIHRWHLNSWARYWFSRIFSSETNVDAWAAFRLFLRCVDSRFWIWHEQIKDASSVHPDFERRWQHMEINWETIRNRIRKNEDGFEKHLFGQKILQKQAWPWM